MAGDWDEHPSDRGTPWNLIPGARPFEPLSRPTNVSVDAPLGHGHVREVLAQAREAELRAEERFKAIPGGLEVGSPSNYGVDWQECGCLLGETGVEERCLQHFRDALYYRNRIKAMRHATLAGLEWPVPKR